MRWIRALVPAVAILFMVACDSGSNPTAPSSEKPVTEDPGVGTNQTAERSVIVVLKEGADPRAVAQQHAAEPSRVYQHVLNGFAASVPQQAIDGLSRNPHVDFIEEDQVITLEGSASASSWGLDRIDQRLTAGDGQYSWDYTGQGVKAYILDTGIRFSHVEFGGRARPGYDAFGGTSADCHGHGTHVAGTVGGANYGVAKGVTLVAVRVLDCGGSGTLSGVIGGLDFVAADATGPAVVNMSLGGGANSSLDLAVENLVARGVTTVVSAGNSGRDACTQSPARTPNAVTVGATDQTDTRTSWSNYGSCVDIFAPGSAIPSSYFSGDNDYRLMSGTSMSSPHVAGAAALVLAEFPNASPAEVSAVLADRSTKGVVKNSLTDLNDMLYSRSNGEDAPPPPVENQAPTARFSYSCEGLTCSFMDSSTDSDGSIASRLWRFGDGSTSAVERPSHTYSAAGTYYVTLTVTDDDGASDAKQWTVTVEEGSTPPPAENQSPTADFSFSCTELTCSFTDASSDPDGSVATWNWSFGDGGASIQRHPSHTFGAAGTYTVRLSVLDDRGAVDAVSKSVTVDEATPPPPPDNQSPSASFSFSCEDLACTFTDLSSDPDGNVVTWDWDYGDGSTESVSSASARSHTYSSAGTYQVRLTVTDDQGATNETMERVTVDEPAPPPPPPPAISLMVDLLKEKGERTAVLNWAGALGNEVTIFKNGAVLEIAPNNGMFMEYLGKGRQQTIVYQVCETDGSECSAEIEIQG